jgi:hypothetical protein
MATSNDYSNNRNYSRILGIPLDSGEKPGESLKVTPDTTAWDIYNYHAGRVESEVVKDWNDTLNTLLVFVSKSAVQAIVAPSYFICRPVYTRRYLRRS